MSDLFLEHGMGILSQSTNPYQHLLPPRSVPDMDRLLGELAGLDGLSDVWITEGQAPRFKRQGEHTSLEHLGAQSADLVNEWIKHLLQGEPWHFNMDAAHTVETPHGVCRYRVSVYRQGGLARVCLRLVNTVIPHHRALMLPDSVVKSMVNARDGLAFFVGATGSGKSTSIASTLTERASARQGHIITLEDPIEYRFRDAASFFSQRQKGQDFETFPDALKFALRQAPDDIIIGEIRDAETADIALHAAETGHFVVSTLHTKRAPEAINRFKLLFPEGQQRQIGILLANLLRFVVCQRLIRSTAGTRMALYEVMHVSNESGIRPLIRSDKVANIYSAMESGGVEENVTFEKHLDEVFERKHITKKLYDELREELELERG